MPQSPITLRTKLDVEAGQAEIWVAQDIDFTEPVAVKFLRINADAKLAAEDRRRFAREVRCQSALRHASIMPILRYDIEGERPWYSMPKAEETFEELLSSGPMQDSDIIEVIADVLDAIEHAHSEGVLHRDLKPGNILRLASSVHGATGWVVADFGLCQDFNSASTRITQAHTVVGSIAYMAPEQFDDAHNVTMAADIYSLGKVLAHAFTGKRPFPVAHLDDVPAIFRQVVRKCLAEEPTDRYQSVIELRADLLIALGVDDDVLNPTEECTRLAAEIEEGNETREAVERLIRLLISNSDNATLHTDLVRLLKRRTLVAINSSDSGEFRLIVQNFDKHTDGSFPWSFADHVAGFFRVVYEISDDLLVRRLAVNRILVIGYDHHRFNPRQVFIGIAAKAEGMEAAIIGEVLRGHPSAAAFIAETAGEHGYAPVIAKELFSSSS